MASTDGWFYVDASTGQPVGPYDMRALQGGSRAAWQPTRSCLCCQFASGTQSYYCWMAAGLISNGMIRAETPLWKEGREAWLKLAEIDELEPLVMVAAEVAKSAMRKCVGWPVNVGACKLHGARAHTRSPAPVDELQGYHRAST